MDDLSLIGILLVPFLMVAVIYREEMIMYFLVLDSWIILRISQVTFFHPALSLNKVLTVFALVVVITKRLRRGKGLLPKSGISLLSFTVIIFLIYLTYSNYSYTGKINPNLINNIVFFYLCVLLLEVDFLKKFNNIAIIVLIVVAILSMSSLFNIITLGDVGQRSVAGNRNHTAFYVMLGVSMLFALGSTRINSRIMKIAINIVIACSVLSIALSLGRTVTTIMLACMVFYMAKGYIRKRTGLFACLLVMFLALLQADKLISYKDKLLRIPESSKDSVLSFDEDELGAFTSGRNRAYEIAWDLYLQHPVMGIGYDRWAEDLNKGNRASSMHSRWLQILVETGPPGAVLYAALYLICFIYLYRITRRSGYTSSREKHVARGVIIGLTAFFLMGITDNHGYTDRIFYFFLAITEAMYTNNKRGYKTDVTSVG